MESMRFYNLCVHYINSLIFIFRATSLEFELSHSMYVFNAVNVCCYE